MKKTIITLVAAIALGAPLGALAQDSTTAPVVIPEDQPAQPAEQQAEQPQPEKKKKKQKAEQPEGQAQPQAEEQTEQPQPEKKRKKKQQAEQPEDQAQPQAEDQTEQPQPEKKRKKKQQAEQPEDQAQPQAEEQTGQPQPEKKKKKQQAEQPEDQAQPQAEGQAEQPQPEKKKKKQQTETTEQPADTTQPATGQTTEQPQPEKPATAEIPPEVTQYLSDTRPANELSDEELAQRARAGRDLVKTKGLPEDVRQELAGKAKKARAEAMAREQAKTGKTDSQPGSEQQTTEQPAGEQPATGEVKKGDQAQPADEAAQPNPDKKQVQQLDGNKAAPEAEAKARTYLDDTRPADQLKDDELKTRLDGMRDLLAGNELSRDTERAMRRKLKDERDVLRNRVAEKVVVEEKKDDVIPGKQRRDSNNDRKWDNWAERDVLRDRRRSDELEEGELRRRIDIYRDAINDDRYDDQERAYWRDSMERDRRYMRDRLLTDRGDRERYWRDRRDKNEVNIDININLGPDREPPESAFMDEIDDEQLEDYLVAAPRRKVARRYTVAEIEEEPEIRTAMPAIEIDNIHFGFNESFVREEEVDKLDRIAEVLERILAAHPGEVFMIGGHTDAVGPDAYNLKLSRERALAVRKALTTYYVIPARNLVTAGYGERYLKIPTAEAEEENRRVSLQRVTPLVGEAE